MDGNEQAHTLVEEREEEMVTHLGSQDPIKRKGWFLKPLSNPTLSQTSPSSQFASFQYSNAKSPKASFRGWVCTFRQWDLWVKKLKPIYRDLWKKVGIFDAINVSTYKFRRDPSSLWGVVRFWCGETNTFLFPWAEATVTLEDVMILGGFSVLGDPVRVHGPLEGELGELESEMSRELKRFNKSKCKKADSSAWLKYYMEEGNGGEVEHIAFLALWISRFVLSAHPIRTVRFYVIQMAVRLARGIRIAFAPAVLASIYRDLRRMKDYLVSNRGSDEQPPLVVWAPLNILQLWIWERFLALRPEPSSFVDSDEPRAARWHNVGKTLGYSFVMSVMRSPDEVEWRPYVNDLEKWSNPIYSRVGGGWVCSNNELVDDGLRLFAVCLRGCELVGIDCIEQYLPHRVARQFGLDQNIPTLVPRGNLAWEVAWGNYDITTKNIKFYVPPRLFEADVALQYAVWWKSVRRLLRKKKRGKKRKKKSLAMLGYKKQKVEGTDDTTLSDWLTQNDTTLSDWLTQENDNRSINSIQRCEQPPKPSTNFNATQGHHVPMEISERAVNLGRTQESCETVKRIENVLSNIQEGTVVSDPLHGSDKGVVGEVKRTKRGKSLCEPVVMDKPEENLHSEDRGVGGEVKRIKCGKSLCEPLVDKPEENLIMEKAGEVKETNRGEFVYEVVETETDKREDKLMMEVEDFKIDVVGQVKTANGGESGCKVVEANKPEENFKMETANFEMEELEKSTAVNGKKSELELDIEKLKKEIALIHAQVMKLEASTEVHP